MIKGHTSPADNTSIPTHGAFVNSRKTELQERLRTKMSSISSWIGLKTVNGLRSSGYEPIPREGILRARGGMIAERRRIMHILSLPKIEQIVNKAITSGAVK